MKRLIVDPLIRAKHEDLMLSPVVVRVTQFDEPSAAAFAAEVEKAHHTGQPVIPVVIDSFGGQAHSLLDMIGVIQASRLPIATIVHGKAMSCGSILFGMGSQRFMSSHATLMIHDVAGGAWGKVEEVKSHTKETSRIQRLVYAVLAKNVGKPADYFTKIIHDKSHAEWYLTPREATKHNLCTHIGSPTLTAEVAVSWKFGVESNSER